MKVASVEAAKKRSHRIQLHSVSRDGEIPASSFQERMFFLHELNPDNTGSNGLLLHEMVVPLNEELFSRSLVQVIKRHEIFRTRFKRVAGRVVQIIESEDKTVIQLKFTDLSSLAAAEQSAALKRITSELAREAFDLGHAPLCRFQLFKMGADRFIFARAHHHIITDNYTNDTVLREIKQVYAALRLGKPVDLPAVAFHYADYAAWESENVTEEYLEPQMEYWKQKLTGAPDLLHLPLDRPRPAKIGSHFEFESLAIPVEIWNQLKAVGYKERATSSMLGMAVFSLLLHRYSGDDDVCIGAPIELRLRRGLFDLMGPMINNFVIRSQYDKDKNFHEYLRAYVSDCLSAYKNSDLPVDKVIKLAGATRSMSYAPLCQAMFEFFLLDKDSSVQSSSDLKFKKMDDGHGGAQDMDLVCQLDESPHGVKVKFTYNADLFERKSVVQMLSSFKTLTETIAENPHQKIGAFPLLNQAEQAHLLKEFCGSKEKYPTGRGIQEYFEQQADKTPHAVALDFETKKLTYLELDSRANQLAHYLRQKGVSKNVFVGILMDRSLEMFVSILGTLKAGGAYVPMEPNYPSERLQFLFEDIEAPVILTQGHLATVLPSKIPEKQKILFVDKEWDKEISKCPTARLASVNDLDNPAYMIYTSGSTGKPKGCPNSHRNVGNYLQWVKSKHPMKSTDKLLFRTPYTFDVSVPEILYPLFCGAQIVICAPGKHGDTTYMVNLIQEKSITEVGFVPSTLQVFLEEEGIKNCSSIKVVTAIGEALPPEVVKRFFECLPQSQLINSYGPTEAAVAVTYWDCSSNDRTVVPIGYPIPNNKIYILNEHGQIVPPGVFGEIYIGGIQVALGYWKRLELTAEKFVKDPFSEDSRGRMYKTGDRGRFLNNGRLDYQGRMDFQVKVRGYRIELGEIESAMLEYSSVKQAAVIVKKLHGDQGSSSIIAYFVKNEGPDVSSDALKDFLKGKIPEYMLPAGFVALEEMPVITSGKVNRKVLMERKDELGVEKNGVPFSAPVGEVEKILAKVWEDVLQTKPVGRDINYFSLGGDSLSLIRTLHKLRPHNWNLKLEDLYSQQTVADLAAFIERRKNQKEENVALPPITDRTASSKNGRFPLSFQQEGLWRGIKAGGFRTSIQLINSLEGPLNVPLFKKCFDQIMERHGVLRTKFLADGDNPYQVIETPEIEYFFEKDLRDLSMEEKETVVSEEIQNVTFGKFDLEKSPLVKCSLLRTDDEQYYLTVVVHHLVYDGLSLDIWRREMQELYSAALEGRSAVLPELPLQYADFAIWERETCQDHPALKKRKDFWKNFLKGLPSFKVPGDSPQDASAHEASGRSVSGSIEKPLLKKLHRVSKKNNATLYVTVLTAFSTLLQERSGLDEIVFNTVFSQRPAEIENLMGYFMSIVPIRIDHSKQPILPELIDQIRERSFKIQSNLIHTQRILEIPFSEKDLDALGSVNIMFNYTTGVSNPLDLPGIVAATVDIESDEAEKMGGVFVQFSVCDEGANFFFLCDKDLYSDRAVASMAERFKEILRKISDS